MTNVTGTPAPQPLEPERQADGYYLVLAGIFIASLVSCNLIFQKFFYFDFFGLYTFEISVGLLPYPITFLATDLICEVYGKKAADRVVLSGFISSVFISGIIFLALHLPATGWSPITDQEFSKMFSLNGPAVLASMTAYLLAQFLDVRLFHFWKKVTKGKHLWIRNNFSTLTSQLVDTVAVLSILCLSGTIPWEKFYPLLEAGYLFKVIFALLDTPFLYLGVFILKKRETPCFQERKSDYINR